LAALAAVPPEIAVPLGAKQSGTEAPASLPERPIDLEVHADFNLVASHGGIAELERRLGVRPTERTKGALAAAARQPGGCAFLATREAYLSAWKTAAAKRLRRPTPGSPRCSIDVWKASMPMRMNWRTDPASPLAGPAAIVARADAASVPWSAAYFTWGSRPTAMSK
jgi:hypothetical protein